MELFGVAKERSFLSDEFDPRGEYGLVELRYITCIVEIVYHRIQTDFHILQTIWYDSLDKQLATLWLIEKYMIVSVKTQLHHFRSHVFFDDLFDSLLENIFKLENDFPNN